VTHTSPGAVDLLADIGNTRSHVALVQEGRIVARVDVPHADVAAEASWASLLDAASSPAGAPARAALVSVNPAARKRLEEFLAGRGLAPRVLGETLAPGIVLDVAEPKRTGGDRVCDALWGARTYPGQLVLVVDLGTAITLNVVSAGGVFLGGAIAPGLGTAAWALASRTANLPRVQSLQAALLEGDSRAPLVGRDTESCIRAGLLWSAAGLVTTYAAELEARLGTRPVVVATGGDARLVASICPRIERVEPDLTLLGLGIALREAR
jgi:type III pantothenate kinase